MVPINDSKLGKKSLTIKSDLAFRAVFGRDKTSCHGALKAFLEAVLGSEIKSITYTNPLNFQEYITDKKSEMDIEVITDKGDHIDLEMQRRNVEGYEERTTHYAAKMLPEAIGPGENWKEMKKVKVINILDFPLFADDPGFHTVVRLMRMPGCLEYNNEMEIILLELPKLAKKDLQEMSELERWLFFIKYVGETSNSERAEAMLLQIISESEGIKMASDTLNEVSADAHMRAKIRMQEKAERDYYTRLNTAERIGLEQGLEQGVIKGREEGILAFISAMEDFDIPSKAILGKLQEKYHLSQPEAVSYYERFSK